VKALADWYRRGHRDLPWRRTTDPSSDSYRIWVSEIMLQQTRAQAAIPYYQRFLDRFPTVEVLAAAAEQDVLALWAGLGYYSRARNLRHAAKLVVEAGGFPRNYDAIRALPGVGDYTAAAIASIAFGLPYAVVDGNVLRVVARMENDAADIGSARTRERFRAIVQGWMGRLQPGVFNQALMELGATVCLPANPQCGDCPIAGDCRALAAGTVAQLPVKLRKTEPVAIAAVLLLVRRGGRVLLRQKEASRQDLGRVPAHHHAPPLYVHRAVRVGARTRRGLPLVLGRGAEGDSVEHHRAKSAETCGISVRCGRRSALGSPQPGDPKGSAGKSIHRRDAETPRKR
jgi:A/G-specific adenine glycosylase